MLSNGCSFLICFPLIRYSQAQGEVIKVLSQQLLQTAAGSEDGSITIDDFNNALRNITIVRTRSSHKAKAAEGPQDACHSFPSPPLFFSRLSKSFH